MLTVGDRLPAFELQDLVDTKPGAEIAAFGEGEETLQVA